MHKSGPAWTRAVGLTEQALHVRTEPHKQHVPPLSQTSAVAIRSGSWAVSFLYLSYGSAQCLHVSTPWEICPGKYAGHSITSTYIYIYVKVYINHGVIFRKVVTIGAKCPLLPRLKSVNLASRMPFSHFPISFRGWNSYCVIVVLRNWCQQVWILIKVKGNCSASQHVILSEIAVL